MTQHVGDQRIARLQAMMREEGIDALLCIKPEHAFYLSGFNPIIWSHPVVAVLPVEGEPSLLLNVLRDDHSRADAWVSDIRLYGKWGVKETMGPDWTRALLAILEERKLTEGVLGIEEGFVSLQRMKTFRELCPKASFRDASKLLMTARMRKEPYEVDCIRKASALADAGVEAAIAALRDRASEREASVRAMAAMNQAWVDRFPDDEVCDFGSLEGGVQNGLWCWTLIGDRVAINCDNPTNRRPVEGELATIFTWTVINGCHAENERTVAIGTPKEEPGKAFEALLEIRAGAESALRPGVTFAELYGAARAGYQRLGYEKYLPGRIGHGVGLGAHEAPSIGPDNQLAMEPGMTFTFEPNLRIPSFGGLQHSDTVLITDDGYEFLTRTDRGFLRV